MRDKLPDVGINPDWGLSQSAKFRVRTVSFGDGYEQRAPDGLNATQRSWNLSWSSLDKGQADTLNDFILAKGGHTAFLWEHPVTGVTHQVLCSKAPKVTHDTWANYTLSLKLTEDFTP